MRLAETAKSATRYARQLELPEIGPAGQKRIRRGRILIVGAGGLGAPAGLYLAAAGVGTLGFMDPDVVELSNLQRQIIHDTTTLGQAKVESAAAAVRARNPEVKLRLFRESLGAERVPAVFADFDFVIDGTDSVDAKFLINDGAIATGTPYSHAGVAGWIGQTMTVLPGAGACYRCLFPVPPAGEVPSCQYEGIFGAVAGALGLVQATEALKYVLGIDGLLVNRLLTYDALALRWRAVPVRRNPRCPVCAAGRQGQRSDA